jgi:hypothetical protein
MKRGNFWFGSRLALLFLPLVIFSVSCGGGGGDSGGSTGTMNLSLTDQATTEYQAIYVTIAQVEVQKQGSGGWQVVPLEFQKKTVNLLILVNGVREELALATLATGHYTQMRLILGDTPDDSLNILSRRHPFGNYFIDNNDESFELKIPSGFQTGIKIVKGFDINENQTTELLLDFDAARSIVKAGSSGKWLLKPTVKVLELKDCSIILGSVKDAESVPVSGVLVSAQVCNSAEGVAEEDWVEVKAATLTDESGNYKLFLEPGTYTLVAYKDGYSVSYKDPKIVTTGSNTYPVDFTLYPSDMGSLSGSVPITDGATDQYATISIRQSVTFLGSPEEEQIEIKSLNVAKRGSFSDVDLPVGGYTVVISTLGKIANVVKNVTISKDSTTDLGSVGW